MQVYYEKELVEYLRNFEKVIIYGAGYVGTIVADRLLDAENSINIYCFAISEINNTKNIYGIPVHNIEELISLRDKAVVVIATFENKHKDMIKNLLSLNFKHFVAINNVLYTNLRKKGFNLSPDIIQYIKNVSEQMTSLEQKIIHMQNEMVKMQEGIIKTTPQARLSYFILNILDHCNANCKGCNHFSPLAEEYFVSLESIDNDLKRMALLMNKNVDRIGIMGGEPLLHPDLNKIIIMARASFPNTDIQLVTNGILLLKQTEEFWQICRESNIEIVVTKYPINLDFEGMKNKSLKEKVEFGFYGNTEEVVKTLFKEPLDIQGRQDSRKSFSNCSNANNCSFLMEGKLYPCPVAPNIHLFNKVFGTHMELEEGDWLDINEAIDNKTVLNFISKPIPFCRYCAVNKKTYNHLWENSKKVISEWTENKENTLQEVSKNVYNKKFFEEMNKTSAKAAKIILPYVLERLKPKAVIDFGCGTGIWLAEAKKSVSEILGLDGDYIEPETLAIDSKEFLSVNLENEINLGRKFDMAISLEVAEHIKEEKSDIFIHNITRHADVVLFSAAIPGQGGTNHCNEQWLSYWEQKFAVDDFILCDCIRNIFWNNEDISSWRRENTVLFCAKDKQKNIKDLFETNIKIVDMVHPELYFSKIAKIN